jgi:hypothetical protein
MTTLETLRTLEAGGRPAPTPATPDIAPLERFVAPSHLDGSAGTHRCKDACLLNGMNDRTAIEWWVTQTSNNETTARSRRSAVEKLLNWSCFVRGKAVSSLDEEDFAAFAAFLANPEPLNRWVGGRQDRESAAWRPFAKPLATASRQLVLKHIASLASWLSWQRYADLRFFYGKRAMDDGFAVVASEGARRSGQPADILTIPEWHWIRRVMDGAFPATDLAPQRLIMELLYYGNLYVEEIAKLEVRNFEPPNRVSAGWSICVQARPVWRGGQMVFTPPPLSDTLDRWIKQREASRAGYVTFRIRDSVDTLLGLEGEQVARNGRQVLRMASSLALERGDVANGMRLRDRSLVCLRGSFAAHQHRRPIDHDAIELTGRAMEFGLNFQERLPPRWDWCNAVHLWSEPGAKMG